MVFYDIALSLATLALVVNYFPLDTCSPFVDCVVPLFVVTFVTCAVLDTIAEGIAWCFKPSESEDEDEDESESESESDESESDSEDDEEETITFEKAAHPVTGLIMEGETLTIVCRGDVRFKIEAAATLSSPEAEQEESLYSSSDEDVDQDEKEEEEEEEAFCLVLQQE
ncbi:hypothetical protein QKT49_gp364 [Acanthamoeba castellanii medusavirus]|uniref:Uncharacterized protein n=1 Tax=Acanthamoeba castellanii medusavirus J1 TaxID=3114988 RepID=A0A3T1CX65_9VIRU|nr:hypothetical protein QKT49_gp364 [Acanthamoeba castellanii medusavirus]BBI30399.1 hypothetical protein [Acanthamoeba castellanii medusavirus J1]